MFVLEKIVNFRKKGIKMKFWSSFATTVMVLLLIAGIQSFVLQELPFDRHLLNRYDAYLIEKFANLIPKNEVNSFFLIFKNNISTGNNLRILQV